MKLSEVASSTQDVDKAAWSRAARAARREKRIAARGGRFVERTVTKPVGEAAGELREAAREANAATRRAGRIEARLPRTATLAGVGLGGGIGGGMIVGEVGRQQAANRGYRTRLDMMADYQRTMAAEASKTPRIAKAEDASAKRKEQQLGLANNAFGAAAGAYGTRAVYQQARAKHMPEREKKVQARIVARQQRISDRAAERYKAGKNPFTVTQRAGQRVRAGVERVPRGVRVPLAVGTAVGSQLLNAGLDAHSAHYFGRELATRPKTGTASKALGASMVDAYVSPMAGRDGIGRRVGVSKRRFDSEADRQHRLGIYSGLGVAGAGVGAHQGITRLAAQGVSMKGVKGRLKRHKVPLLLLAGAGGSAGLAGASSAAYRRARDEAWT